MSAWMDFMNTQFPADKPVSQRLAAEAHRVGNLGDSKAEKLLKLVLPAIAELEGAELTGRREPAPPGPRVVTSEKPSEINRVIIESTAGIDFPRLADVTSAAVHDCRMHLQNGLPANVVIGALINSMVLLIGRLEHEIVKLTSEPINVPPTG